MRPIEAKVSSEEVRSGTGDQSSVDTIEGSAEAMQTLAREGYKKPKKLTGKPAEARKWYIQDQVSMKSKEDIKILCRPKKAGAGQRMLVTAACQQFGGHMSEWNGNKPGQYYKFSNTCNMQIELLNFSY